MYAKIENFYIASREKSKSCCLRFRRNSLFEWPPLPWCGRNGQSRGQARACLLFEQQHEQVSGLLRKRKIKNVFFFANPEVYEWFAAQDPSLNLRPSVEETELVLVAYHNSFDYRELCELSFRVQRGIPFWVTHTDFVCPDERGPVPDIGSFMALLKTAYGVEPEMSFGKPNPAMLSGLLKLYRPEEILFVGDRLYTDFELAKRSGCRFVLPLCGESKMADVEHLDVKPEFIVNNVSEIDFNAFLEGKK